MWNAGPEVSRRAAISTANADLSGTVEASSEGEGKGSEFVVKLPAATRNMMVDK